MEESLNQLGEQGKLGERSKRISLRLINTRHRLRIGANTHRGTESVPQIVKLTLLWNLRAARLHSLNRKHRQD